MTIFKPYSREELKNPQFYTKIFADWAIVKIQTGEFSGDKPAKYIRLARQLELSLNNREIVADLKPELLAKYRNLLVELKFFLLVYLDSKEIINLFKEHFVFGLQADTEGDLPKNLRVVVMGINRMGHRDPFLADLRQVLKENKEIIGNADIFSDKEKRRVRPYLSNWLFDYEDFLGVGKHGTLEITNYFFKSQNVRHLDIEGRKLLRKIIDFYELLKLTVTDPGSLSSYPIYVYGFRQVGAGIKTRYLPNTPEAVAYLAEEQKKEAIESEKKTRGEKNAEKIIPGKKTVAAKLTTPLPKEKPKKLEEGLSGQAISQDTISKLNSLAGISQITIEDFRVFHKDSRQAARFVFSKIKKLIADQPALRFRMRQVFQNSPLYKLYLSCGKEAMDSTETVGEVAKLRQEQNRPYLSEEEYKAVAAIAKAI